MVQAAADVLPVAEPVVHRPAGHAMQLRAPADEEKEPAGHGLQLAAPASAKDPAGQSAQPLAPAVPAPVTAPA